MTAPQRWRTLVDAYLPAGEFPSGSAAGIPDFLAAVVATERPEWAARIDALADAPHLQPESSPEGVWFATLVSQAYAADATQWSALGWSPDPPGGWPSTAAEPDFTLPVVPVDRLRTRYDVIVVGSGPGGSVAAAKLAATGRSVLVVEWGDYPPTATLARDHLRNARVVTTLEPRTHPRSEQNPRVVADGKVPAWDPRWGSNAMTAGGGSRVYGAQAWRFVPEDFTMASTYGVPPGSALADWPIGYDELEPFYSEAEWALGVSGADDPRLGRRSRPYPMPAQPMTDWGRLLATGAERIGLGLVRVPLAVNSGAYQGRPGCAGCRQCVGFSCPIGAKNDAVTGFLGPAARAGDDLHVALRTRALRITTDADGRVRGVAVSPVDGLAPVEIEAADVVVAAGAIESARLLLTSATDREPYGLGNNTDQVGRHLQGHVYGGALGVFDDPVASDRGPGPVLSTHDVRHHNDGLAGGGMIANEFTPTPVEALGYLRGAGLVPPSGPDVLPALRDLMPRMQRIVGPVQEVSTADARVRLDPRVSDSLGVAVARLEGGLHPNDLAAQALLGERAVAWLEASGARQVVSARPADASRPSSGQHQAGTCRMGTDPATSVTDPYGRVWGHPNLRVIDGSTHVTNGGVNPMLTIFANSLRVLAAWTADDA